MNNEESIYKFVILGEGRVGKTSILVRYFNHTFDEGQQSTVNAAFYEKDVTLTDGTKQHFKIWDTAGQEQFNAIQSMYYRQAKGAILVYDISNIETLEKVDRWIQELQDNVPGKLVITICGNKYDLVEKETISNQEKSVQNLINKYKSKHIMKHFLTSAKTAFNIEEVFAYIFKNISSNNSNNKPNKKNNKLVITKEDNSNNNNQKKGCC